ncbi:hypothetical protein, partial [Streptomyces buecherae]|uniref:hypothetical protein n=1 Tax=Streptomyces buecherae TaxID=2763006 RepID=UPI001C9AA581
PVGCGAGRFDALRGPIELDGLRDPSVPSRVAGPTVPVSYERARYERFRTNWFRTAWFRTARFRTSGPV